MRDNRFRVQYRGSLLWLIFWIIIFFPIALALFFTACTFEMNRKIYYFTYSGSRLWLCFWVLAFFPIALILLLVNGISIRIIEQ